MKKFWISLVVTIMPAAVLLAQNPGDGDDVLPVVWKGFNAVKQGERVLLRWETASEQHSKSFVVEHRGTASGWDSIGTVAAAGNSTTVRSYAFVHSRPVPGMNTYRLRQLDLDGRQSLSRTVSLRIESRAGLTVLGNPVERGMLCLQLQQAATVLLYDGAGRQVYAARQEAGLGSHDVSRLPKGFYTLEVAETVERILIR